MSTLSREQIARRQRTLGAAVLLSLWAPLATGLAVVLSSSLTQVADFIRRTVELFALAVSWLVFRYIYGCELEPGRRVRLERLASICVAAALGISGLVMLVLGFVRLGTAFAPGGNVYLGLAVAVLGAGVNGWFWRRYTILGREEAGRIISAQRRMYRAKTLVDFCVIAALASVAVFPDSVARYVDLLGNFAVAGYLLWSSARAGREALGERIPLAS